MKPSIHFAESSAPQLLMLLVQLIEVCLLLELSVFVVQVVTLHLLALFLAVSAIELYSYFVRG